MSTENTPFIKNIYEEVFPNGLDSTDCEIAGYKITSSGLEVKRVTPVFQRKLVPLDRYDGIRWDLNELVEFTITAREADDLWGYVAIAKVNNKPIWMSQIYHLDAIGNTVTFSIKREILTLS